MSNAIHVTKIAVKSFQRIKAASIKVLDDWRLITVTGECRSGKTSLIRALGVALGGAAQVLPDPIHDGDDEASVHVTLSNGYEVFRKFTAKAPKGYLTVEGPDGGRHGQSKLNEWLGPHSFDPLAFFELSEGRQIETLLALSADPKLKERLSALRSERRRLYDERTPYISDGRAAAKIERPDDDRPEAVDLAALMDESARLEGVVRARESKLAETQSLVRALDLARQQCGEIEREIERLQKALEIKLKNVDDIAAGIVEAEEALIDMPDPAAEIEVVRSKITSANEVSAALNRWANYDDARATVETCKTAVRELTDAIESSLESERKMLASAGIPVSNIGFDDDGHILLNGHPLSVASGAERMRFAAEVAVASAGDIKICLLDEGNNMDMTELAALKEFAEANDIQIWLTRIDMAGHEGYVNMEDGESSTPQQQRVT